MLVELHFMTPVSEPGALNNARDKKNMANSEVDGKFKTKIAMLIH
jgi:hypothetical protein